MSDPIPVPILAAQGAAGDGGDLLALAGRGAVALLVGLLVGAEREFSQAEKKTLFAGVRTFPLIALLGFTGALLADITASPAVFAAVAVAFTVFVTATYVVSALRGDAGATTEIAALTVFFLGALIALVGLASRAAYDAFQEGGLYAVSAVSGLADVDGLTVAVAGEARRAVLAAGAIALILA